MKIPIARQQQIRLFASMYAQLQRTNTDLAGWFELKFSCSRGRARRYADWYALQRPSATLPRIDPAP